MVTFSVGRGAPSAKVPLKTMASSLGELTLVFEMRTLRQLSMSMPSRLVSILMLSMVRLSTPVTRMPKWPPFEIETSRMVTLWQSLKATVLSAPRL